MDRTDLARKARRIAEEVENLYAGLEQVGALPAIRHYMIIHQEGIPSFDMLQTAKALRCYAGVLAIISRIPPKPEAPTPVSRPKLPGTPRP